jgi:type II secretory pathway component GspD/PulD (secretin)
VTIAFREFGVRINFTPVITPRGTIRLSVTPEVSSLDYANGLVFQGFTIPGLATRRVQTEIELEEGQTFAIGGLLDNRDTETFNSIPGLSQIPFFGKLFRSRQINKSNTELLVIPSPQHIQHAAADARSGSNRTRSCIGSGADSRGRPDKEPGAPRRCHAGCSAGRVRAGAAHTCTSGRAASCARRARAGCSSAESESAEVAGAS